MKPEILRLASEMSQRGEPFVLATVVWRRSPSSLHSSWRPDVSPGARPSGRCSTGGAAAADS